MGESAPVILGGGTPAYQQVLGPVRFGTNWAVSPSLSSPSMSPLLSPLSLFTAPPCAQSPCQKLASPSTCLCVIPLCTYSSSCPTSAGASLRWAAPLPRMLRLPSASHWSPRLHSHPSTRVSLDHEGFSPQSTADLASLLPETPSPGSQVQVPWLAQGAPSQPASLTPTILCPSALSCLSPHILVLTTSSVPSLSPCLRSGMTPPSFRLLESA